MKQKENMQARSWFRLVGILSIGARVSAVLVLGFNFFILSGADASSLFTPKLLAQTNLVDLENLPGRPHVVQETEDHGVIVAGGNEAREAWATKVDASGKIEWRYRVSFSNLPVPYGFNLADGAYTGVVPMKDGSVYLCGTAPHEAGKPASGLLTHLDNSGHVIAEQLIHASPEVKRQSLRIDACTGFDNGIVIVGSDSLETYQAIFVRGDKTIWEVKALALSRQFLVSGGTSRATLLADEDGIIFCTTDNLTTEVIRFASTGKLIAHVKLDGAFVMVRPIVPDRNILLFGKASDGNPDASKLLFLNDNLAEIDRIASDRPTAFVANCVYRLADGSLIFFGTTKHTFGQRLRATVASTDSRLNSEEMLELPVAGSVDDGWVRAAGYLSASGVFAETRTLITKEQRGTILGLIKIAQ